MRSSSNGLRWRHFAAASSFGKASPQKWNRSRAFEWVPRSNVVIDENLERRRDAAVDAAAEASLHERLVVDRLVHGLRCGMLVRHPLELHAGAVLHQRGAGPAYRLDNRHRLTGASRGHLGNLLVVRERSADVHDDVDIAVIIITGIVPVVLASGRR